jgi:6-phosphogluconate dehydrogenase
LMTQRFHFQEMTTDLKFRVGIIGLGRIGSALLRILTRSGEPIIVFDSSATVHIDDELLSICKFAKSFEDFYSALLPNGVLILCLPAGDAIDEVLSRILLSGHQVATIIDSGNSYYEDSIRRSAYLGRQEVNFVDLGVSGGVHISDFGPCLMPGGNLNDTNNLADILSILSFEVKGSSAKVKSIGPVGSGHFVKMVHNGIEYAFLQLWTEFVHFHTNLNKLRLSEVAEKVRDSKDKTTRGYISEITSRILDEHDFNGEPLLHRISDFCGANGTGALTIITAAKYGVPCNVLSTAVECRQLQEYRRSVRGEKSRGYSRRDSNCEGDVDMFQALRLAYACAFTQGLQIIKDVSSANDWNLDLLQILDLWRNGSIIRGGWIDELLSRPAFTTFEIGGILNAYLVALPGLRRIVSDAISYGYAMPCHSAALSFLDSILMKKSWIPLVAAQRDYFGGHGFRMHGSSEIQRWKWS